MSGGLERKQEWPASGSRVSLGLAIFFICLAIGQAGNALEATKTTSIVFHCLLGLLQLGGSGFYFFLWRKKHPDGPL